MRSVIEMTGVNKQYNGRTVIDSLSLAVPEGVVYGFLGPNGAGKTTTVRLLNGLILPNSGTIRVLDYDVVKDGAKVRQLCGVQTDTNLYESLTVRECLETWGILYGLSDHATKQRVDLLLERFHLTNRSRQLTGELSKGLKQKVLVAR